MTHSVYIITNSINAKQYVGITSNLKNRWNQHKSSNGSAPALHSAFKKYGYDAFVFTHVCEAFDVDSARNIEKMLIIQHNTKAPNGYNLTDGGEGVVGRKRSLEEKKSSSISTKEMMEKLTKEEKSKKFGVKGRKYTAETIKKISQSNIGKNLGKIASKETKAKMSAIHKSRPRQPLSDETKEKIRKSLLGRKMPESEKPKHASFLGRKHTEETKAKISAKNIATKAINKANRFSEEEVKND